MFRCNLPTAHLAEWLTSFTCHCGNTGMERTPNKSQHTKLTLEEKILPPLWPGFELATFRSRVRRSNQQAIPAPFRANAGREDVIIALTTICNKIWQTGELPSPWTQNSFITLPKKDNLQQCQNFRTISLISHPSKATLKIIPTRLKQQAGKIIAEEQADFRAGRSITEQIFSLRILSGKY